MPASSFRATAVLLACLGALFIGQWFVLEVRPQPLRLARGWPAPQPLIGIARAEALPASTAAPAAVDALERYNQGSTLQGSLADGRVRFYRRAIGGGEIAYIVAEPGDTVSATLINADNARPASDANGNTIWADGGQHLRTVAEMAAAPYAARDGWELAAAMAFGFHGDVRTSNEGSVVIDREVLRVNPGRAALCIYADGRAEVGLFGRERLAGCAQAVGAGPIVLWEGRIANPEIAAPTTEFMPYNPFREDFVQIDWRRQVYTSDRPKSLIGVGARPGGRTFLVLMVSYGVGGVEAVRQLRDMGCDQALAGDDDSSTQAVWRGQPVRGGEVRPVPDAFAIYVRKAPG